MHQKISFQSGQKYLVQFGKCENQDSEVKSGRDGWLEILDYLPHQPLVTQLISSNGANLQMSTQHIFLLQAE